MSGCRFCAAPLSVIMAELGRSPLSNALVTPEDLGREDRRYPLTAYVCSACRLVQLEAFETPESIFGEYAYFSSFSDTWLEHVERYAQLMRRQLALDGHSLVVEVASNDGYLLRKFSDAGVRVLGVEPARNVAAYAQEAGIETVVAFLGAETGATIASAHGRADLLVANNVLAHVPDLNNFVAGLRALLGERALLTVEFPHLLRLIERCEFDTIYHEHFSYFSLLSAKRVFEAHDLRVVDVEELPTHGGSLRVHVRHMADRAVPRTANVDAVLAAELAAGLDTDGTYERFNAAVAQARSRILSFVSDLRSDGKRVAGYGAPAKATTLLNSCGIGTESIEYTVDRNPYKQGRYIPGVRVPILAPSAIFERKPDVVIIFPWNIKDEIARQMRGIAAWGGRFAALVPSAEYL